ncbi:quinone oxidoreductase [Nakamurella silvestris]|nr:quinone oxidoreductase [Nakamurella silvestris]
MAQVIQVSSTGGPEVLVPTEARLADPGPGQVLIDVAAAGVNFIDIYQRQGVYQRDLPYVPGSEGAGRIAAVGPEVSGFAVGDRVAWESLPGSYAAQVVGPADRLIPVPDSISDVQAAAVPLQGLTAHYLARTSYPIRSGDTVLIHAGAGGVGLLLTQIAKLLGARVFTTVSTPEKAQISRAAGADEVLEYSGFAAAAKDLTDGAGVAAVYDGVGKDTFDESLRALRVRGTMVLFGGASGQVPDFNLQRLAAGGSLTITRPTLVHFVAARAELLERAEELWGWIADDRLDLSIGQTYPLAEAGRAHEDLAARRTSGKLLLIP